MLRVNKSISPYNAKINKLITLLFFLTVSYSALADTLTGKVIKITDGDMPSNNNVLMTLLFSLFSELPDRNT